MSKEDSALMLWSVEAAYFILNLSTVSVGKLAEMLEVEWYHLWRVADYFLKFDKNMPNSLKMHILDI